MAQRSRGPSQHQPKMGGLTVRIAELREADLVADGGSLRCKRDPRAVFSCTSHVPIMQASLASVAWPQAAHRRRRTYYRDVAGEPRRRPETGRKSRAADSGERD